MARDSRDQARRRGSKSHGRGNRGKQGKRGKDDKNKKPKPIAPTRITQNEFSFVSEVSAVSYDPGTGKSMTRYSRPVRAVIEDYVNTDLPARNTQVYTANQGENDPNPPVTGDLFLLTGQPDSLEATAWVPQTYEVGTQVKYLGETYVAIAETDTAPPVTIKRGWANVSTRFPPGLGEGKGNPNWSLVGSEASISRPVVNPSFGWIDNKWQTGTPGETWLISVHPGGRKIRFADKKGQAKAFQPNTTYFIESISVADATGVNTGEAVIFPRGTTFETGATLSGLYEASDECPENAVVPPTPPKLPRAITGRSSRRDRNHRRHGGKHNKKDKRPPKNKVVWAQVRVSTEPKTTSQFDSGQNGIYKYQGPDEPLQRLNAGDGWEGGPDTYEFLVVSEYYNGPLKPGEIPTGSTSVPGGSDYETYNDATGQAQSVATSGPCDDPDLINRVWLSDDYNQWSEGQPGVVVGKNYGILDIECANWRGRDSIVGNTPVEWDPAVIYYPNETVMFKGSVFQFTSTDQLGTRGVSPADESWEQIETPGVIFKLSADGYRVNSIVLDELQADVKASSLVVPSKSVTIYSEAPPKPSISIAVDGDYKTIYATNSSATSVFSSYIYNSASPIAFTLSAFNIDVFKVQWDFGDGFTSTDINPTHTYGTGSTSPVLYTVKVAVTDLKGRFYRGERTISLQRNDPALLGIPVVVD